MSRSIRFIAAAMVLVAAPCASRAEVTAVGAGGFTVSHTIESAAAPHAVYAAIAEDIARWWDGDHSWSGDAANLYFDARLGGCFCEKLSDGGIEHLRIVYLAPGEEIRLQGALGPLQPMGLQGTMTWQFEALNSGSVIRWQYTVHGFLEGGFEGIAPAVDGVVSAQLNRLGAWLEPARNSAGMGSETVSE